MTRFVIIGAGAVGGVIGGFLAKVGHDVLLVARGAHLAALQAHGLRVETPTETFTLPIPATARVTWQPGDVALVATKTQDVTAALRDQALPPEVPVVCMTNGLEAERIALRFAEQVYAGCVILPGVHMQPGVVQVWAAPTPGLLDLGRYPETTEHDATAQMISAALVAAGFGSRALQDPLRWKRRKLLLNLANGAEALVGEAARSSVIVELAKAEALACFAALGLACASEEEDAARRKAITFAPIGGQRARDGGSTYQSLARGSATLETDYLNGEIVLLGRQGGVPTPVNTRLQQIAAAAARARTPAGSMTLDALIEQVIG